MGALAISQIGHGRMGRLIEEFDWSSTSLGPRPNWSEALLSTVELMLGQRHAICLFWGEQLNLLYNDAYAPLLGAKEVGSLGKPASDVWSDIWQDIVPFVHRAMAGDGTWSEEFPLTMTRNGYPEETFWTFSYSPLYENRRVAGMMNVALDATPGVLARRAQEYLQRELIHRVKNTMAVTAAVVSSTLRTAATLDEARASVNERIEALGRAQALIHGATDEISLRELVEIAMKAHLDRPGRVTMNGPDTRVGSQQAVGLSLAVYELATNAVKYGALSGETGEVRIDWQTEETGAFRFIWNELGGPPVALPTRSGFGSRLTDKIVASYFSGTGRTTYDESGVRYELQGTIKHE